MSAFLSLFIVRVGKPRLFVTQGNRASKHVWKKEELKALAECFAGGKEKLSIIIAKFHETHKQIPKTKINVQAREMTIYERRAGDTKKYWYLKKESQVEYGIKVCGACK